MVANKLTGQVWCCMYCNTIKQRCTRVFLTFLSLIQKFLKAFLMVSVLLLMSQLGRIGSCFGLSILLSCIFSLFSSKHKINVPYILSLQVTSLSPLCSLMWRTKRFCLRRNHLAQLWLFQNLKTGEYIYTCIHVSPLCICEQLKSGPPSYRFHLVTPCQL